MATTLIIDGYNLLGAHHPVQHKENTLSHRDEKNYYAR